MRETVNPAALEATDTQFDSEMPDVYKVNGYVWSTVPIHVGDIVIPRSTKGQIKKIEGTLSKKYTVVWKGFPGIVTEVKPKFIATN